MSFRETTITFREEIERIEAERESLAEEVAEMDSDDPQRARKAKRGIELDAHLDGLEWAAHTAHDDADVPQWDDDVDSITLSGLTGGQFGAIEGEVADGTDRGQSAQQVERVAKVRMGTVDAPYIDDGMGEKQEIAAVAGLPTGFLRWVGSKVEELSSVGNDERSDFGSLLAEKASE